MPMMIEKMGLNNAKLKEKAVEIIILIGESPDIYPTQKTFDYVM